MANSEYTLTGEGREKLVEVGRQIKWLSQRLQIVYSTAVSVRLALLYQNAEQDADIACCVQWTIADELTRLSDEAGRIMAKLAHNLPKADSAKLL